VFDGCNLYGVKIYQCDLSRASFRRVVFSGALVGDCQVDEADFTDAIINGNAFNGDEPFYQLEISPKQLKTTRSYASKNLHHCVIRASGSTPILDFRDADLRHSLLAAADFTKCDFANANIYRVTLTNATLAFEQLASTANMRGKQLSIRVLPGPTRAALTVKVDFSGIDLEGSEFWHFPPDWDLRSAKINGCTFRGGLTKAQLCSTTSYSRGDLSRVGIAKCDLSKCSLAGVNLSGARFGQCTFSGADFNDAVITGVNFCSVSLLPSGCTGLTADQIRTTWNFKHDRMKGIILPQEVVEGLSAETRAQPKRER
jgi:uncharacterized protein YjbI with pentapeptide repeats